MDTHPSGLEKQPKVTGKEPVKGRVPEYKETTNENYQNAKTQQNIIEEFFLHWLKDL